MKPRIGITPSPSEDTLAHGTFTRYALAAPYVEAVLAAGGVPVVLPPQEGHAAALLDGVEGLLLSGGGDVEPARYGEGAVHPATYGVSPLRDRFEVELLGEALGRDLPVLGVCRGLQLLNVALGGTLVQHLPDREGGGGALDHRQQERGLAPDAVGHEVSVAAGSLLARVLKGAPALGVNSFHHQAVRGLASGLVPVAHAPDGVVEAVERPGRGFVLAVQWHPELMVARHPAHLPLFQALVATAAAPRPVGAGASLEEVRGGAAVV